MKYVIISIYDGMYGFDVLENVEHIESEREKDIAHNICELEKSDSSYEKVRTFLKAYYNDYDLIIISENGFAEVVKDLTKENQK